MRLAAAAMLLVASFSPLHASHATEAQGARYRLLRVEGDRSASGRFTVRARLAPRATAGELREGGSFSLIGRLAKGNAICAIGGALLRDGFEGP